MSLPKVLIASPTADVKNYCIKEWMDNVNKLRYPNSDVVLFDNTNDGGKNTNYLNSIASEIFYNKEFEARHSLMSTGIESINERLAIGHNDCLKLAMSGNYDYLLHLESDVFPPEDVIEELMCQNKRVIGGVYYRDEGRFRKPMLQRHFFPNPRVLATHNFLHDEDLGYMDGTVKEIAHVGLGCVLMHKSIFGKIKFRFVAGQSLSPDSYFAEDCHRLGLKIYAHTGVVCEHKNVNWFKNLNLI